jgi:hypothetical protein
MKRITDSTREQQGPTKIQNVLEKTGNDPSGADHQNTQIICIYIAVESYLLLPC